MKKLSTLLIAFVVGISGAFAQNDCGPDENGYVASKDLGGTGTTYLHGHPTSNPSWYAYAAQTYHYSGPGSVVSISYRYENVGYNDYVRVSVYNVDASNRPQGQPLYESNWQDAGNWNGWKEIGIPTTDVDANFAVVIQASGHWRIVHTNGDGNGEDLASVRTWNGNWQAASGDNDYYIVPHMQNENDAEFDVSTLCADVNETMIFTNMSDFSQDHMFNQITEAGYSGGEVLYAWDFGDGNTSNTENPAHAYSAAGVYTVSLTTTIDDWEGNVCQDTYTMQVSVGLDVSASGTDLSCFESEDGVLDLTGSGGAPSYEYSIDGINWQAGTSFSGLEAGDYDVYVQDALGCESMASAMVTLSQPTEVVVSMPIGTTSATCGNADGGFTAFATGGDGTLSFSIDNITYQATGDFTGLAGGLHTLYIKDGANGCVYEQLLIIPNTDSPVLTLQSYTTIACYGASDGTITISGSGGTGALQYSVDGVNYQLSGIFTGLDAGVYYPTVMDAAGCIGSIESVEITEPDLIKWYTSQVPTLCNGSSDGQINVGLVIGGIGTISFSIDGGVNWQEETNFSGLAAGSYTVLLQDGVGCTHSVNVVVTEPDAVIVSVDSFVDLSCFESGDGEIHVSATGGSGNYYYQLENWNFQGVGDFYNLEAGTYNITVEDDNQCVGVATATVVEPTEIIATITTGQSTCGNPTGTILVFASGGSGAGFSYDLDFGTVVNATGTFSGLMSGDYDIAITDDTGCEAYFGATIADSDGPSITGSTSTDISCNGGSDGTITITGVVGGTGVLQYYIDGGELQTSPVFTDLLAGPHTVVVVDAAGCTAELLITLVEPAAITVNLSGTNVACYGGASGEIFVAAGGGIGTLAYSIDGVNFQFLSTFTGLTAGVYTITVKDATQCTSESTFTLPEPSEINLLLGSLNITCNGADNGAISASSNGGTGVIEYSIDGVNYQASGSFTGLAPGSYTVYAKDDNGCVKSVGVPITEPTELVLSATTSDVSCAGGNNGVIDLTVTGGTAPYTYVWVGTHFSTTEDIFNLPGGTYNITVTDANGCTANDIFTIYEPLTPIIVNGTVTNASGAAATDGVVDITITGGTPPYSYDWDNGETTQDVSSLAPGVYFVEVTDAAGCTSSAYFIVSFYVGLNEVDGESNLIVYPNPAKDVVNVEMTEVATRVDFIDMMGKTVYSDTPNSNNFQVGVTTLAEGVYFINIYSESGMTTMRIVLNR